MVNIARVNHVKTFPLNILLTICQRDFLFGLMIGLLEWKTFFFFTFWSMSQGSSSQGSMIFSLYIFEPVITEISILTVDWYAIHQGSLVF